jgi:hypothetical protein
MDVVCGLLAAFLKVVQVICFKKADLSVAPTKFKQLHGPKFVVETCSLAVFIYK